MRFDFTDLRLFLHVQQAGSITAGAARSHLTLQAASERIRGMEEALGVALLTRVSSARCQATFRNLSNTFVEHISDSQASAPDAEHHGSPQRDQSKKEAATK